MYVKDPVLIKSNRYGITIYFDSDMPFEELTKEVKNKLKDTEKEIEQAKSDIHYERGFRKFFFWATPVLLAVQTAISIILLLK